MYKGRIFESTRNVDPQKIISILSRSRFLLENEKEAQAEIAQKLLDNGIFATREHQLDSRNIPDFFIDGIAIEVKIKGNARQIYKQCERYCNFDEVKQLILVTSRSMGFPTSINGKPCYYVNMGKSWL